jgi:uncharacterized membrane protein
MFEFVLLIVIGTSVWVGFDAQANKITSSAGEYTAWNGAVGWVLICLLLWIVGFPAYLVRRGKLLGERKSVAPQTVAAQQTLPVAGVADELEKLARLKAEGHITENDYQRAKSRLLG